MKEEIKVELLINGEKVKLGHRFLESICRDIPDIKENIKFFNILAKSSNYEVREYISRNDNLSNETIEILLNDISEVVVDNLLSNRDVNKKITDEQLKVIIEKDNIKLLTTIASNIDDFKSCNRCKFIKYFTKHSSSKVRYSLFNYNVSDLITTETLIELSKDEDFDVVLEAKKELKSRKN